MHLKYSKKELSQKIKELAKEIGFEACGFAPVEEVANQNFFLSWIKEGYQANMKYLENHFNKRMNPALLVPGSKTIIALALNYYPSKLQPKEGYQFSWYAYGDDYHLVMKEKLGLPIGIIGSGTSNDFATYLDLDTEAYFDRIAKGVTKSIDLGKAGDEYFINVASAGMATAIAHEVDVRLKNAIHLGRLMQREVSAISCSRD